MTNREAVHTIDAIRIITVKDCTWLQKEIDKINEACDMAIGALEKQIPVKPVKSKTPRYGMGYEYYDWECPTCGRFLAPQPQSTNLPHHCKCGQAIDWGD